MLSSWSDRNILFSSLHWLHKDWMQTMPDTLQSHLNLFLFVIIVNRAEGCKEPNIGSRLWQSSTGQSATIVAVIAIFTNWLDRVSHWDMSGIPIRCMLERGDVKGQSCFRQRSNRQLSTWSPIGDDRPANGNFHQFPCHSIPDCQIVKACQESTWFIGF